MEAINDTKEVIIEMTPNFLIYCSRKIPKEIRSEFPVLVSLDLLSNEWDDELQIIDSPKMIQLNLELSRLHRILNLKEFVPDINAKKILVHWTNNEYKLKDINEDINSLICFFNKAIELKLKTEIFL